MGIEDIVLFRLDKERKINSWIRTPSNPYVPVRSAPRHLWTPFQEARAVATDISGPYP